MLSLDLWVVCLIGIVGTILFTAMGIVLAGLYQKCGPNQAMIISGFGAMRG